MQGAHWGSLCYCPRTPNPNGEALLKRQLSVKKNF